MLYGVFCVRFFVYVGEVCLCVSSVIVCLACDDVCGVVWLVFVCL